VVKVLERDGQLERLDAALDSAKCGHGRVVFVGGEAGIGKTALVEHFADRIDAGVRVAFGRCDALGTPRALGPFVDAAQALDVAPAAADRDTLLGDLVAGIRSNGPVLLVVEDAHWADDATIDLVAMLGRRSVDLPLAFVVTYREDEVGAAHPLRQALGNLATTSGAAWIGLQPLSIDAVRQLAEPHGASADEVYALTGGNPFYVTEALAAPPGSLSTSVRLAVLARASRLSASARDVLDAVAIVPGRAETWLLDGLVDPAVEDVDECLAAGVLLADHGDVVFRHELARRAIEQEIPVGRVGELHRRAVATLADRPNTDPARLAHHAERGGDEATLASASAAACHLAAARSANRETIDHGERALAVAEHLTADEVAELKLALSVALQAVARSDEAIALAEDVAAHWRALGEARREAAALIALCSMYRMRGRTSESTAAATGAVELLEQLSPGPELAAAYGMLTSVHMLARNRDEAVVWGERAVSLATELDNPQILGRSLIEYGVADVMDSRFEGLERIYQGIEIGRSNHLPGVVTLGFSQIGSGCGELRRYDHAVPALVEGSTYAAEHDLETARQYIVSWLARCRFDLGEWDDAEAHAFDVLGASRRGGIARFVALNTLGWLRARRGDDDVWPLLDEALEIARQTEHLQRLWPCAVARAEAGWLQGSLDDHVGLLEEMLSVAESCRHHMAVGELCLWLGRAGRDPLLVVEGAEPFVSWNRGDALGAAAGFLSIGCPYEAASAQAASGDTASLRLALATFDRLGATPAAERAATELRARGARVSRSAARGSRPTGPGGLSEREVEVLRLVAAGFTNPQIAATLYISRKTAEHHVSNILTKLGVASRTEAAAASVRLGISPT
jgi:DNA-binding CsgD family transcriptional regulator/tetratricopeptide (TPR) repeat protein